MNSSAKAAEPRIVIRRKKCRCDNEKRGGAWLIAYSDFVTAMMAFFLVMWILSLIPKEELSTIAEYFRMPLMEAVRGGGPSSGSESNVMSGTGNIGDSTGMSDGIIPGTSPALIPHQEPARGDILSQSDRRDHGRLEDLKSELDSLIESDPILEEYRPQLLLDMTPDGLRVQIIDRQNRPMFAIGSARMQPDMTVVLRALAPLFNRLPNKITLTGHTDAVQYSTGEREYSNWELSADRANAARKELVAGGMDEPKVKQVLGLSSTVPLIVDDPNAAVNRRISIVVLNQRAERRIDEQQRTDGAARQLNELLGEDSGGSESEFRDDSEIGLDQEYSYDAFGNRITVTIDRFDDEGNQINLEDSSNAQNESIENDNIETTENTELIDDNISDNLDNVSNEINDIIEDTLR